MHTHTHREGGEMLCIGEIHGIVVTSAWQIVMGRVRDQSMQGHELSELQPSETRRAIGGARGSRGRACIKREVEWRLPRLMM